MSKKVADNDPKYVFDWYWAHGQDKFLTLRHFKFIKDGTPQDRWANNWSKYVSSHRDLYNQSRDEYFEYIGITPESIITGVWSIASTVSNKPSDRLSAYKLLNDILNSQRQETLLNKASRLVVEFKDGESDEG